MQSAVEHLCHEGSPIYYCVNNKEIQIVDFRTHLSQLWK